MQKNQQTTNHRTTKLKQRRSNFVLEKQLMKKTIQFFTLALIFLLGNSAQAQSATRMKAVVTTNCLNAVFVAEGTLVSDSCASVKWTINNGTSVVAMGKKVYYTFSTAGTYTVCAKLYNTCKKFDTSVCTTVTVVACDCKLTTEFSFKNDCKKGFFVASSNQKGATYTWNFGDKTEGKGTDPTHTYISEGVYKVCVTATWKDSTGKVCTATFCKEVKISCGKPCDLKGEIGFTNTGGKFRFKASSNSGYSYEWSFGDGQTGKGIDPYHEYAKAGTYTVCVTITDKTGKCKIKICKTVVVSSPCNLIGSYSWKKLNDSTYKFYATSNGGTGTTYTWSWGDGTTSTGVYGTHVYKKSGVYEVCLKIYNSTKKCFTYVCKKVEIVVPSATKNCKWEKAAIKVGYSNKCNVYSFEMTLFADSCIKYQLSVYDMKTGKTYPLPAGRTGTYTFSDTGKFAIIAKYSNKCTGCDTQTYSMFNVTCKPATSKCNWAAAGANLTYANKCNVYTFEGKNMSTTGNCFKYSILVGNSGATTTYNGRVASHTFKATGTYTVCIKYTDSCKGCDTMICTSIKVDCSPCAAKASFTVDSVASNGKMYVKNTSTGAKSYSWNFGDSTAASKDKTPVHQFSASGAYTVCLTAYDSTGTCSTVYCYTVKVVKTRSNKSNTTGSVGSSYPNPADAGFYINLGSEKSNYVVYSSTGQIVTQGNNSGITFLDSKNWADGIYQISIKNATGNRTESVMIAH
jgi:PKD repeat protein